MRIMDPEVARTNRSFAWMLAIAGLAIVVYGLVFAPDFGHHTHLDKQAYILADLRTMRTAVESYAVDWKSYPEPVAVSDRAILKAASKAGLGTRLTSVPNRLTTPIAYIRRQPVDHGLRDQGVPFFYFQSEARYLLYSAGPDSKYQLGNPGAVYEHATRSNVRAALAPYTYDATNGQKSAGDLWVCAEHNWPW